ncbi:flagellin N-terminal helical domain-containing protein [Limimaricola cinnabarinus]|uniref:Flagellin n=1 Tax=Limimaricola cinnabarinus LL-001 TaxID=1337093 RepID=U2YPZ7_9RHOB|nr:flagellin [Limimaricola cinnabarinus]GAD57481.1 flagellin protein flaA [Limimaricola cinnabarinus LL-001]
MSSILTNNSAMSALSTLRNINSNLSNTQDRISSGLKVQSGKDNAAYFSISETMKGDSGMTKAVNEGLTLTKNVISTGRLGAETVSDLAKQFVERVAFAQGEGVDRAEVQKELVALADRMDATISQSNFNGSSMFSATAGDKITAVTGITRDGAGAFQAPTTMDFGKVDLQAVATALRGIDVSAAEDFGVDGVRGGGDDVDTMQTRLTAAEAELGKAIDAATTLGVSEKTIETQQSFLTALSDKLDSGIGSMVDADMEEEAARLQSLQVQQQLSTQALSIANQAPQNILSLFR